MLLKQKEFQVPRAGPPSIQYFRDCVEAELGPRDIAVRFAVTGTTADAHSCELGVLTAPDTDVAQTESIFSVRKRRYENRSAFNAVMLVPTGIGAEIGGHAGDACPAARLLASVCDTFITHPNVVNASDINEMPANGLYVEGSAISDLLMGACGLMPTQANRVLLIIDKHTDSQISSSTINAVSAARAALGLECPVVVEMDPPIVMWANYAASGTAGGTIGGLERICDVLDKYQGEYDAVALASVIGVPTEYHKDYFDRKGQMVNPWGGVEAMLTHAITKLYGVPTAHAPMFESAEISNINVGIVDPRMSAEAISECFLHCVLKGLHSSPRITRDREIFQSSGVITAEDISCLVIPDGCIGLPTLAAIHQDIPVIAVKENKNLMQNTLSELPFKQGNLITVENYLEAAGVLAALRAGVSLQSVRRPLEDTVVVTEKVEATDSGPTKGQRPTSLDASGSMRALSG